MDRGILSRSMFVRHLCISSSDDVRYRHKLDTTPRPLNFRRHMLREHNVITAASAGGAAYASAPGPTNHRRATRLGNPPAHVLPLRPSNRHAEPRTPFGP